MKRILGAVLLLIILALPAVCGPAWLFAALVAVIALTCLYELFRITLSPAARPLGTVVMLGSLPFLYLVHIASWEKALLMVLTTSLAVIITGIYLFEKQRATALDTASALAGLVYPLTMTACWIVIRNGADGHFWMLFGLVGTFASDTGAYYAGRSLGRHKLAPRLSPKKTVEGLFGGLFASMLAGTLLAGGYNILASSPMENSHALQLYAVLAGAIALVGLAGDLTASMFKRQFNVKDMGNLIPGHGGMLDRMDGAIPAGALLLIALKVLA